MKQVLKPQNIEFSTPDAITDDSIVGVQWRTGDKSYIIRQSNHTYVGIGGEQGEEDKIEESYWTCDSKREYAEEALEQNAKVFVFETYKELYKWMAGLTSNDSI